MGFWRDFLATLSSLTTKLNLSKILPLLWRHWQSIKFHCDEEIGV